MNYKFAAALFLLMASLVCTAWAAGAEPEPEAVTCEVNLFQCGSLEGAQTIPGQVTLLDSEEEAYQWIYQGLLARQDEIRMTQFRISRWEAAALYEQVVNDNPELFYVGGNVILWIDDDYSTVLGFIPEYLKNLPADAGEKMEQAIAAALSRVEPDMSQAEKALVLHNYLVDTVAYDRGLLVNGEVSDSAVYSAYGALVNGDAVCNGYALAYQMLLKQVGINAIKVTSTPMDHAWNLVEIDGSWYHVDTTWDDPAPNLEGGGNHFYFLRSDESMNRVWDTPTVPCPSDYIEGWWLYNNTQSLLHRWNGAYYYLGGYQEIYRAETLGEDPGVPVVSGLDRNMSSFFGVRWVDGQLYYLSMVSREAYCLKCCNLTTGSIATVGEFPFAPASSVDGLGLRYDGASGVIEIHSILRPELGVLFAFPLLSYPAEWDSLPLDSDALAGCAAEADGTLQAGLVWTGTAWDANFVAAFYRGEKLVRVQVVHAADWTPGLNVVKLDVAGYPAYDRVALFLLSNSAVPLCAAWQEESMRLA